MKYSKVCGLDKEVSKLVFGTATPILFKAVAKDATEADKNEAFALLDSVFAMGVPHLTVLPIMAKR